MSGVTEAATTIGLVLGIVASIILEVAAAVGVTAGDICAYAIRQSQGDTISAQNFVTGFQSDLIAALVLLPIVLIVFCEAINRKFPLD